MTNLEELLSAAKSLDESPPPEAGARMWANVAAKVGAVGAGVAGAAAMTAGVKSASAATATTTATTAAVTASATTSSIGLTLAKITTAVALTAGIGVGVAKVSSTSEPEPVASVVPSRDDEVSSRQAPPDAVTPRGGEEPEVIDVEPGEAIVVEPAEVVEEPTPRVQAPTRKRRSQPEPTLADESALLGKAKIAASKGHNQEALQAIRAHAKAHPNGELAEVRRALEVKVLCQLGRTQDARKAADRFLQRHRSSALAGQVRSSCAYPEASE